MTDRTPQTKGVLRVFGYDPEGPEAPPKAAPSVQPVWSQQDIDDWAKSMGGPWFIPPCYVAVPATPPELLDKLKAAAKRMTWADSINAAYAHVSGASK